MNGEKRTKAAFLIKLSHFRDSPEADMKHLAHTLCWLSVILTDVDRGVCRDPCVVVFPQFQAGCTETQCSTHKALIFQTPLQRKRAACCV